ncbi:PilW family protein [Chitiniphilus purpureus]|uniref:PilW family protein n=1 Tax=Chitiniphilus purpureus TaxID=2981137 RepID=A0ABY6DMQ6_9NEIS|nr:PilW family protein [Chitiniphilus sp. CD1]UXY15650.1 PilW family protein [Chitiniphilus sp. CD1]
MHRLRGFTIVELMIGLSLALLLALAIASVYSQTRQTFRLQAAQSRLSDDGQYVLETYKRMLTQSGYRSWNGSAGGQILIAAFPAATPFAAGDTLLEDDDGIHVRFYGDTDGNVIRCETSNDADYPFLKAAGAATTRYTFVLYHDDNADTLNCAAADKSNARVLVSNVVDYSMRYGQDTGSDRIPDQYVAAAAATWAKVYAARLCVVLRSAEINLVNEAMKYQDCSGVTQTATDKRLYRTFTATVQLRNRFD